MKLWNLIANKPNYQLINKSTIYLTFFFWFWYFFIEPYTGEWLCKWFGLQLVAHHADGCFQAYLSNLVVL